MGVHHRPMSPRRLSTRSGSYQSRHGLVRVVYGMSRTGHRLARASRQLSRQPPTPAEALLPWGVVLVGVGVLIGLLVSAFVVPIRYTSGLELPDGIGFRPSVPLSPGPSQDTGEPDGGDGGRYVARDVAAIQHSPTPAPSPSASPSPSPSPEPEPDPDLSGKYRVEESHRDVFIGNVVVTNHASPDRDWTVELAFSSDVGKLNTFWVDGTPQPTLQRVDDRYVFTSTVPVPGRSWVVLKVHFDRSGFDINPTTCTVNGGDCVIGR